MHRKVNLFLFILGAILSVLSGVLELSSTFSGVGTLLLIILGVFIGLLNIDASEEAGFLLAALTYLFSVFFITPYMQSFLVLQNLSNILVNVAILTASATVIVSLRWVMTFSSGLQKASQKVQKKEEKELVKFEKTWAIIMLFAVAVVLVQVVLESFFDTTAYDHIIEIVDYIILVVFVIDLGIIYAESNGIKHFLKTSWLDILATIPFNMFFRLFKLVRIIRVVKLFKVQKVAKVSRINRALKFFSHKSKFNKYIDEKK